MNNKEVEVKINAIYDAVVGSTDKVGLISRVEAVEKHQKASTWWVRSLLLMVAGVAVKLFGGSNG